MRLAWPSPKTSSSFKGARPRLHPLEHVLSAVEEQKVILFRNQPTLYPGPLPFQGDERSLGSPEAEAGRPSSHE